MRHLSTIPVFTPYPATGYGFDDESKKMLGDLTWGDVHHPALSETNGDYDGRWLFVNEMNGRVARIDLRDFKTKQILGPVPNVSGNHASAFVTPNSEYSVMASRFSIPIPKGTAGRGRQVRHRLQGRDHRHQDRSQERRDVLRVAGPDAARSTTTWATRARRSRTASCSSRRTTPSAPRASWRSPPPSATATTSRWSTGRWPRRLAAEGKGALIGGVKVLNPKELPGLVYLLPCGKSPHGVDVAPDGNWIVGSGKLQGVTTVFNFEKIQTAIRTRTSPATKTASRS